MARALVVTGLDPERAYLIARYADKDLNERGAVSLDFDRLGELASELIGDEAAARTMRRLRQLDALARHEDPLLLLIGGATGTGKSTIATEAAHRLGITRVTSTDFVRQTMRAFFSQEFMPSIHYSSFEAGASLREPEQAEDPVIAGFLEQTRNVLVGVRASIDRALEEGWSTVLEGVHLVPGMVPRIEGALVAQCVLKIDDIDAHYGHFMVRDATSEGLRPHEKYTDRLHDIRRIQDHIVARASRHKWPVIENSNIDVAIVAVIELVLAGAEQVQRV
jgi:2-phosphoglycerate kinase